MTGASRSRAGLYPEEFTAALRHHLSLPVRSEKQKGLTDLFVDNRQLHLIRNSDWQIIYGRRGTGKTMLLGVLKEQCSREFEHNKILAVSITAQDLLVSPTSGVVTDKQRALAYFQVFLENISEQLVGRVDELLGAPSFVQKFSGTRRRLIDKIQDTAIQILMLVQTGKSVDAYIARRETVENSASNESESRASAEMGASARNEKTALFATISAQVKGTRRSIKKTSTKEELTKIPRFALARAKIIELLKELGIHRLDILIDEWQTLDPQASTGIQPEFAEYLKRTFFGAPEISIKIATNRYQTRFSNKGSGTEYRGLEVGADIFEATNLDRTEQSLEEQVSFYSTLVYRRLVRCESRLSVYARAGGDAPNPQFALSLFRDEQAFEELVKGASATPRDFLLLFNSLAKARAFSNDPTWTVPMIHDVVREGGANLQEETDSTSEADQLLTRCIKGVVERTGSRLFLVDRDDRDAAHNAIEELVQKRLIDEYSRSELGPDIRTKYDAFLVHYGLWLDWRSQDILTDKHRVDELPAIAADDAKRFQIEIDQIDSDMRTCQHCGDHFSSQTRSFRVAGLCPNCFQGVSPTPLAWTAAAETTQLKLARKAGPK